MKSLRTTTEPKDHKMKKGYKVTDRDRSKLVGIACESLTELRDKGRQKLGMTQDNMIVALDDGTIVDDEEYFQSLPPQTLLILYRGSEDILTGVDFVLRVLRQMNKSYLEVGAKARDVLLEKTNEIMTMLKKDEKAEFWKNTPDEDPDWFMGLETNVRSKDEYMHRKSQDRIRGYLYKFQEDVRKSRTYLTNAHSRRIIQGCLEFFKKRLKKDGYFGCYFDRRCAVGAGTRETFQVPRKKSRISPGGGGDDHDIEPQTYDKSSYCDVSGNFTCQGKWQESKCEFGLDHHINPYQSRETRIVFSTWNLDHRIERSRSVAPTLLKAVESCGRYQTVNFLYFYQLLFTKVNLKLVHVVCHDKSVHNVVCDRKCLYL